MPASPIDLYEILGVPRDASAAAVKAAYLRLIVEHPPESDPEMFRVVSGAYRVLGNPERRKAYDAEEQVPDHVVERIDAAMGHAGEDPARTARMLGALARKHPEYRAVRFLQGVALHRAERYRKAASVFEKLREEAPSNAAYASWLGDALVESGNGARGAEHLQEAIALDAGELPAYIALARWHLRNEQAAQAREILEAGIQANAGDGLAVLPLFLELMLVHAIGHDEDGLRETARRIEALAEGEDAAKRTVMVQVAQLAALLEEMGNPEFSELVLDCVPGLAAAGEEFSRHVGEVAPEAEIFEQGRSALDDPGLPDWIKALVAAVVVPEQAPDLEEMVEGLRPTTSSEALRRDRDWSSLREHYPAVARLLEPVRLLMQ